MYRWMRLVIVIAPPVTEHVITHNIAARPVRAARALSTFFPMGMAVGTSVYVYIFG